MLLVQTLCRSFSFYPFFLLCWEKNLLSVHFLQNVMKAMNCSSFGIKMSAIAIKPAHTQHRHIHTHSHYVNQDLYNDGNGTCMLHLLHQHPQILYKIEMSFKNVDFSIVIKCENSIKDSIEKWHKASLHRQPLSRKSIQFINFLEKQHCEKKCNEISITRIATLFSINIALKFSHGLTEYDKNTRTTVLLKKKMIHNNLK